MKTSVHYEYCCRTVAAMTALLRDMQQNILPSAQTIRLQRQKNDIVRRSKFDALRRAFLTPIDRDDLFWLCILINRALFQAETIALENHLQQSLHTNELLQYAADLSSHLETAVAAFANTNSTDTVLDNIDKLQRRFSQMPVALTPDRLYDGIARFSACCRDVADGLLLIILRNE